MGKYPAGTKLFVVITKDGNGAPSEAYRGPHERKANDHKALLLQQGKPVFVETITSE